MAIFCCFSADAPVPVFGEGLISGIQIQFKNSGSCLPESVFLSDGHISADAVCLNLQFRSCPAVGYAASG
jgi:hypothetical protein